ncbi:MAG: aminoacyl-tRNA hydrolase [Actinomycetota bacterium]
MPASTGPWLAVGLGNPGVRYGGTRHNAGSRVVERLAYELGVKLKSSRALSIIGDARVDEVRLILANPTTYMNESGRAVGALIKLKEVGIEHLIVVHDEIDLPAGSLKIKFGGGAAGHRGIESIVGVLGTKDFYRVRVGVGRSLDPAASARQFVLEPVTRTDAPVLIDVEKRAGEAVISLVRRGLEPTMNDFNFVPKPVDDGADG